MAYSLRPVVAALACMTVIASCKRQDEPSLPSEPLTVEFAGCAAVTAEPVCELGPERTLRLWVEGPESATVVVRAPETLPIPGAIRMDDGWVLPRVVVPRGAREVRVEVQLPSARRAFTLRVAAAAPMPWYDDAKAMRQSGKLDEAAARLEPGLRASGVERARALGLLARIELARGKWEDATTRFREAIAADRASGRISDVGEDTFALAFVLSERGHRYVEADAALDALADLLPAYPEGRARAPYTRALLARHTGEMRKALPHLRDAQARAARLGMTRLLMSVEQASGLLLNELGRFDEALDLFRDTSELSDATPCDRVMIATNLGYTLLLLRERGDMPRAQEATKVLEGALPLIEGPCSDALARGRLLSELALAELQSGGLDAASRYLERSRAASNAQTGALAVWDLELEGRIALARKDTTAALAAFDKEARLADGAFLARGLWTATVGRAAALEARGELKAAADAYTKAEAALDEATLLAPLGEGRDTFVSERETSAKRRIDLLLRLGRTRDAMAAARVSRGRILSAMQRAGRLESLDTTERTRWEEALGAYRRERDAIDAGAAGDWQLSAQSLDVAREARQSRERQLRATLDAALEVLGRAGARSPARTFTPPADGTLVLLFHPVEAGWVGFAEDAKGITFTRVDRIDPEAAPDLLANALLAPFRAAIDRATRIRVMPFGILRAIDVHALPWNGAPLIASKSVDYAIDLAPPATPRGAAPARADAAAQDDASTSAPWALVVADPTSDLAAAAAEGSAVEAALRARGGWQVDALRGRDATSRALFDALPSSTLFHYAGHGVFGGLEGLESTLPLANGSRLTVGDVLALPRAPSIVVLSACEGARTAANAAPEGLGLAHAFIAAGSEAVIAPTRRVPDALAADVTRRLYASRFDGDPDHAVAALRDAVRGVIAQTPDSAWSAFRVVTP